jgi:translation initiation factor eIF-2B subunit beta
LEDLHKNINDQATNHIHAGEVILTYGKSRTVQMVRTSSSSLSR